MKSLIKALVEGCAAQFRQASKTRGFDRVYVSVHSSDAYNDELVEDFAFQLGKHLSPEGNIPVATSYREIHDGRAYDIDFDGLMKSENEKLQRAEFISAFLNNYRERENTSVQFEDIRLRFRELYGKWFNDSFFADEMGKFIELHPNLKTPQENSMFLPVSTPVQAA